MLQVLRRVKENIKLIQPSLQQYLVHTINVNWVHYTMETRNKNMTTMSQSI
jgi:hypothetical protein